MHAVKKKALILPLLRCYRSGIGALSGGSIQFFAVLKEVGGGLIPERYSGEGGRLLLYSVSFRL